MVEYSTPLTEGTFIKRYKRFLADIQLPSGEVIVAHVPNTGSMMSTRDPGAPVAISYHPNPKRKLKWTLELVQSMGTWVGVNTSFSNRIVENALRNGEIPELDGYESIRREVKYGGGSRVDLLLESAERKCYVEIKNVTWRKNNGAFFPDAVTVRGAKHLRELMDMTAKGHDAVMFFLVNRNDCQFISPAAEIDPIYTKSLITASQAGVKIMAYSVAHTLKGCNLEKSVPVKLPSRC